MPRLDTMLLFLIHLSQLMYTLVAAVEKGGLHSSGSMQKELARILCLTVFTQRGCIEWDNFIYNAVRMSQKLTFIPCFLYSSFPSSIQYIACLFELLLLKLNFHSSSSDMVVFCVITNLLFLAINLSFKYPHSLVYSFHKEYPASVW